MADSPRAEEAHEESAWSSDFSDTGSDADAALEPRGAPAGGAGAAAAARSRVPQPAGAGAAPAGGEAADGKGSTPDAQRDPGWRAYRRALEWRCRWVELRMCELRDQEARYARLAASAQRKRKRDADAAAPTEQPAAATGEAATGGDAPQVRVHAMRLPALGISHVR